MIIKSNIRNYSVNIETNFNFIRSLVDYVNNENTYYVIDKNVYDLYFEKLFDKIPSEKLTIIESLETNKTIESALSICEKMTSLPAKRNAKLISFGGGIIQDITGFTANILYRGIHWTFVPTTLLAACDSCIGGKTSLNYKHYKNLLGTFYPPEEIFICSEFFKTLSDLDFKSGLGEVVKFNIMSGDSGLLQIEHDIEMLLKRDDLKLSDYIENSLAFKKSFVEEDEFDLGIRINLNFAHTFGHAFESISNFEIPHGTAVAMGMIAANRISLNRGLMEKDIVLRSEQVVRKIINLDLSNINFNIDSIISAMKKDKKQISTDLTVVLLYGDMELGVFRDIKKEEIEEAIISMLNCLKI